MKNFENHLMDENDIYDLFGRDGIDDDHIMFLVFCDGNFSHVSFAMLYPIYDDVDVYVVKRTKKNINSLKFLDVEIDFDELDDFVQKIFDDVLYKFYFGS